VNVLPELQTGEAMVWSPAWLKFAGKVHVLPKVTFDSSKTPDGDDDAVQPKVLAPVEVEQLRLAMASAIAKVEAEDPEALKRRVRQLEVELAARPPPAPPERVEVPAVTDADRAQLRELGHKLLGATAAMVEIEKRLGLLPAAERAGGITTAITVPAAMARAITSTPKTVRRTPALEGTGLKKGAREMLRELAALHPKSLTRRELATRVTMAHEGGSTGDYISALRAAGLLEDDENGDLRASAAGLEAAGAVTPKSSGELAALWRAKPEFKRGVRAMLDALLSSPSTWFTREQLAHAAGMEASGGSTGDYISALVASGCADARAPRGGPYIAGHALFMGDR
jgi:hypothetical protein